MHPLDRVTYPEVGATAGELPSGYHHLRVSRRLGAGRDVMDSAVETLLTWRMHERAGLRRRVEGPDVVAAGADVAFRLLGMRFECRVVEVVDEPDRRGFAYGTLARHPEVGEERFEISIDPATEIVTASVIAFSRPAGRLMRVAGPTGRFAQRRMAERYLAALVPR